MNQRFITMIVASVIFVFVMHRWVGPALGLVEQVPIEEPLSEESPTPDIPTQVESTEFVEDEPLIETEPAPTPETEVIPQIAAREDVLENDVIRIVCDSRGGVIREVTLKNFKASKAGVEPINVVSKGKWAPGELVLAKGARTNDWVFHVEAVDRSRISYTLTRSGGTIRKTLELGPSYGLRFECKMEGFADQEALLVVADGLRPMSRKDFEPPSLLSFGALNTKLQEVVWFTDGDREERRSAKIESESFEPLLETAAFIQWFGIADSFFGNVFRPDQPVGNLFVLSQPVAAAESNDERLPVVAMPVDGPISGSFYFGPKSEKLLVKVADDLPGLVDYGWAGVLSKLLYKMLAMLHGWTGNWGWSIVFLTLFIRLALLPMTIPSVKSSFKMRKLQPKLEALKKKYPGTDLENRQKLQQEQFALYKQEGINPFSSCIIMLPQLPIFFAYFSLLRNAIELRHSGWMWWIQDLSSKDPTYILPILMGATMYLTQLTMPMPGDPAQQKMMRFMPIMMAFMFIAMPSGLILYMITSNFIQLGQTMIMKWRYQDA